jgi:hypothetical protein
MDSISSLNFTKLFHETHLDILTRRASHDAIVDSLWDSKKSVLTMTENIFLALGIVKEEDLKKKKVRIFPDAFPCRVKHDATNIQIVPDFSHASASARDE